MGTFTAAETNKITSYLVDDEVSNRPTVVTSDHLSVT